jgi:hypothetical protein
MRSLVFATALTFRYPLLYMPILSFPEDRHTICPRILRNDLTALAVPPHSSNSYIRTNLNNAFWYLATS